ncbi:MAG: ATP F0F1 synthase subunit B [Paracoccaceae bacterium]|nr:ATP F0F1 synthase subunit B [Paracoccaceae bacterium]MDE2913662.1 ATP F0F1 synthase subunit B [Paracoccaceae bacterium]
MSRLPSPVGLPSRSLAPAIVPGLAWITLAGPACAASGPFFSLNNTDFVVTISFLLFVALLIWVKAPGKVAGMLDRRAEGIAAEIEEARSLRDEARALLDASEQKRRDADEQAERIITRAHEEAAAAVEQARQDLKDSIEHRVKAAEDRIASAEAAAVREVRDASINVAISAAADVIASRMSGDDADILIDRAIDSIGDSIRADGPRAGEN